MRKSPRTAANALVGGERSRARWTHKDLDTLRSNWGEIHLNHIAARLQRSPSAVWLKAKQQGLLHLACFTTVDALSKVSGFDRSAVTRILRRAEVPLLRSTLRPIATKRKYRRTAVDHDLAILAIEDYLQTESLRSAATSRNTNWSWLRRRLVRAGIYKAEQGYRYLSAEIDAAIAAWPREDKFLTKKLREQLKVGG